MFPQIEDLSWDRNPVALGSVIEVAIKISNNNYSDWCSKVVYLNTVLQIFIVEQKNFFFGQKEEGGEYCNGVKLSLGA